MEQPTAQNYTAASSYPDVTAVLLAGAAINSLMDKQMIKGQEELL